MKDILKVVLIGLIFWVSCKKEVEKTNLPFVFAWVGRGFGDTTFLCIINDFETIPKVEISDLEVGLLKVQDNQLFFKLDTAKLKPEYNKKYVLRINWVENETEADISMPDSFYLFSPITPWFEVMPEETLKISYNSANADYYLVNIKFSYPYWSGGFSPDTFSKDTQFVSYKTEIKIPPSFFYPPDFDSIAGYTPLETGFISIEAIKGPNLWKKFEKGNIEENAIGFFISRIKIKYPIRFKD